jgi:hypothetical protein
MRCATLPLVTASQQAISALRLSAVTTRSAASHRKDGLCWTYVGLTKKDLSEQLPSLFFRYVMVLQGGVAWRGRYR